jgi:hypothetical protein
MVFYDLTSTYFEGKGPPETGAHGHSRDGKPRNPQVLVGLVLVDGWPIAHHVFEGNWRDAKTVPAVLRDLEQRFGLGRVVFVGDRGMVTGQNLVLLHEQGHGYIVGRNRRRSGEVFDYIQSATGPWIECPTGITAGEKTTAPKTLVQEVAANEPGVRVFVVHSDERLAFERAQRIKAMDRVRARLEKLQRRIADGRLKAPDKIGAAAAKCLARNHGHRYYGWSYDDGVFRFFEHPVHFTREQAYEGKYVIQTEEPNLSAVDAVRLYKELRQSQERHRHATDLSPLRPPRAGPHLRRRTRIPAPPRHREEAQGRSPRSLRHRGADHSQIRPRRRHRSRRRHHQTLRHRSHSTRGRRAARPRHHRSRPADPANPGPNRHVVTNHHPHPRKINGLQDKMSNMG